MVSLEYCFPMLLLVFFLIKIFYFNKPFNNKKNLPPSPPRLPVIGNLHQLGPFLHRSLHSLSKNYGGPLMLIHLGSVRTLVVSSAEGAREIMKTHDLIFANRPEVKMWRKLLYDLREVSVAPYGEYWRQVKSIVVLHLLSNKRVKSIGEVRDEEIATMVDKINKSCNKVVDLSDLFVTYTNDVVCRVTFGRKYSEGEIGNKFKKTLRELLELLGGLNLEDLIPQLAWIDRLRGFNAKVDRVAREVDEFLEGLVEERPKKQLTGDGGREDFIDILLKIQKDDNIGVTLDKLGIKALLLDVYTAGTDTTATVLEWTFSEILKHPKIFKKVQDEVRLVVKGKKHINQDDLDKMKYLKAVFKESLRLHPPNPTLVPRVASQDVEIMGYNIEKGTRVVINAWAIARDPKMWDEPNEFRPERFLDCSIDFKGLYFDLIPFGAGRRGCPGISFGMATNEHALANLLLKFDWKLPNGGNEDHLDMSEQPGFTIRRKLPLFAYATPFTSY